MNLKKLQIMCTYTIDKYSVFVLDDIIIDLLRVLFFVLKDMYVQRHMFWPTCEGHQEGVASAFTLWVIFSAQ